MSWLKLTSGFLYLMQGGTDLYIDKVKILQSGADANKVNGEIKEFPHRWFTSSLQRPKTIVVNLDEEIDGIHKVLPFSEKLLKYFEVPVSSQLYEELKKCQKVSELIDTFDRLVGGFSDDFFTYEGKKVLPPSVAFNDDAPVKGFPKFDYKTDDPDYDEAEPSFASILLQVVYSSGLTVKPLLDSSAPAKSIRVKLNFFESDLSVSDTEAVELQTLDLSLKAVDFQINDQTISEIKKSIKDNWGIPVEISVAPPGLGSKISLELMREVTFTTVMNAISRKLEGVWGWDGNTAFITLPAEKPKFSLVNMADVASVIDKEVFTVKVDSKDEVLVLTASFNGGPITVLVDDGTKDDIEKKLKPPKVYTFNADPFFRRTNHYIASGSLSIRPDLGASPPKISITVSFSNMFPNDLQPTGGAKFSLRLFSPLGNKPELIEFLDADKTVGFGETKNIVLLIYSPSNL
jgi:hypothetical protein